MPLGDMLIQIKMERCGAWEEVEEQDAVMKSEDGRVAELEHRKQEE